MATQHFRHYRTAKCNHHAKSKQMTDYLSCLMENPWYIPLIILLTLCLLKRLLCHH